MKSTEQKGSTMSEIITGAGDIVSSLLGAALVSVGAITPITKEQLS